MTPDELTSETTEPGDSTVNRPTPVHVGNYPRSAFPMGYRANSPR